MCFSNTLDFVPSQITTIGGGWGGAGNGGGGGEEREDGECRLCLELKTVQ